MNEYVCVGSDAEILAERPAGLTGVRVFAAEDEPMLLWALEQILAELGCEVIGTATQVADALAFVKDNIFDVAVLDGRLADGHIQPVADLLFARGTPMVITSGGARWETAAKFNDALYLQKPYKCEDLKKVLLAAMA
jgi:DNA-binding NtrC family response regulator